MVNHNTQLIVHIVFRFDYGGLENGVTNLINSLSDGSLRHAVIALTEATKFKRRLNDDVPVFALKKMPGKDLAVYYRLYKLLRKLKPTVVHTRNIGTLDCSIIAFLARVPIRIHSEHGWDVSDPDGTNMKYRWLRKILSRFVHRFVTVSADLHEWLVTVVGIPAKKVTQICNGVDTQRFCPGRSSAAMGLPSWFGDVNTVVIGTVTRFSAIKDPMNLIEAFIELCGRENAATPGIRLAMLGDGELHNKALTRLEEEGLVDVAWLPGSRDDVAELLGGMDVFALASFREGISNTLLEAMASGLPVVATDTGGNRELVDSGTTGALVPPADSSALAAALATYVANKDLRHAHGSASRERTVDEFSLNVMVGKYRNLYASALRVKGI